MDEPEKEDDPSANGVDTEGDIPCKLAIEETLSRQPEDETGSDHEKEERDHRYRHHAPNFQSDPLHNLIPLFSRIDRLGDFLFQGRRGDEEFLNWCDFSGLPCIVSIVR